MKKRISRVVCLLMSIAMVIGCSPSMQVFATSNPPTQKIVSTNGTDTIEEFLPDSSFQNQNITTSNQHYDKDITLSVNFATVDLENSGATTTVQGHEIPATYKYNVYGDYTQVEVELKNVQSYVSPSNNAIRIDVKYGRYSCYVYASVITDPQPDQSKPYISAGDMWDHTWEQLPDRYSSTIIAQKAHRNTYMFNGALILTDAESFEVSVDGTSVTNEFQLSKGASLGYGFSLYNFSFGTISQNTNPDADGYSTIDICGTDAAGIQTHVYLKIRFFYR